MRTECTGWFCSAPWRAVSAEERERVHARLAILQEQGVAAALAKAKDHPPPARKTADRREILDGEDDDIGADWRFRRETAAAVGITALKIGD